MVEHGIFWLSCSFSLSIAAPFTTRPISLRYCAPFRSVIRYKRFSKKKSILVVRVVASLKVFQREKIKIYFKIRSRPLRKVYSAAKKMFKIIDLTFFASSVSKTGKNLSQEEKRNKLEAFVIQVAKDC